MQGVFFEILEYNKSVINIHQNINKSVIGG